MQMWSSGPTCRANVSENVAPHHVPPVPHGELRQMAVTRHEPESVIDDYQVAVIAAWSRDLDPACRGCHDWRALVGRNIEAWMKIPFAIERICAHPIAGTQPAVNRPDRRRCVHQRLALFNVPSDDVQMAFQAAEHIPKHGEGLVKRGG